MAAEQKISAALESELDSVDKQCIRPLQVKAFQCCARCCSDQVSSQTVLQNCLQNCMVPVAEAEQRLKAEVDNLQGRLSRCAEQCQDKITDHFSTNPTPEERERATRMAESCLMECADSHITLIPKMIKRVKEQLGTCS